MTEGYYIVDETDEAWPLSLPIHFIYQSSSYSINTCHRAETYSSWLQWDSVHSEPLWQRCFILLHMRKCLYRLSFLFICLQINTTKTLHTHILDVALTRLRCDYSPHRTAPGPYRAGNDWLCHFDDELKGIRRANYPQLTKEMNPTRCSWWVGDGRIQWFLVIQLKPKHRGIHCYALLLLVTVVGVK